MFLFLLVVRLGLSCVHVCSRDRTFSTFSIFVSLFFLLFLFTAFLKDFSLVLRSRHFGLLRFGQKLLCFRVFYQVVLGASPSEVGSVVVQTSLVYLFNVGRGLQACLGLGIDRFLNDLGPTVQLSASLLYLSYYWWLKAFAEEIYQVGFLGRPGIIEFE